MKPFIIWICKPHRRERQKITKIFEHCGEQFGAYKTQNKEFKVVHLLTGTGVGGEHKTRKEAIGHAQILLGSVSYEALSKAINSHSVINPPPFKE